MLSLDRNRAPENALQKRLRHYQVTYHVMGDLIAHCGEDGEEAHAIGRRLTSAVQWTYTGTNGDAPSVTRSALRERLIVCQLVAHLSANAMGQQDAEEISRSVAREIDRVWGQRDLRLVC